MITNPGQGSDVIVGAAGTQAVYFQNLAPVYDNVPAPLTVVGTPSNNTINYEQGPNSGNAAAPYNGDSTGLVTVDNFEALEFSHKTTLTLQGLNGDDTFTINNITTPTGLTAINVHGGLGNNTLVVDANSMPVLSSMVTSAQVNIPGATPIPVGYDSMIGQVSVIHAVDALTSTGASIANGVEGVPLNNVLVGTFQFTDPVPPSVFGNPLDFTATINWGDGSATSGDDRADVAERRWPGNVPGLRHAHVCRRKPAGDALPDFGHDQRQGKHPHVHAYRRCSDTASRHTRCHHDHAGTWAGRGRAGDRDRRPDQCAGGPDCRDRGQAAGGDDDSCDVPGHRSARYDDGLHGDGQLGRWFADGFRDDCRAWRAGAAVRRQPGCDPGPHLCRGRQLRHHDRHQRLGREQDDRQRGGHRGRRATGFHRLAEPANHPGGNTI